MGAGSVLEVEVGRQLRTGGGGAERRDPGDDLGLHLVGQDRAQHRDTDRAAERAEERDRGRGGADVA